MALSTHIRVAYVAALAALLGRNAASRVRPMRAPAAICHATPIARPLTAAGLPADPNFFPIAVWLQEPANAGRYRAAGTDLYAGLWQGPTAAQLDALQRADMPVLCEQNSLALAQRDRSTIAGWLQQDEPDNAQPVTDPTTGKQGYGPFVPPARVVDTYNRLKAADPSRPVILNLGQGVANDEWIGRGNGAQLTDYETYVKGGDIISFDVYPMAGLDRPHPENYLWYVAKGVDRLVRWTGGHKPVWACIECTRIGGGGKATPEQVRSEVWMALTSGARGITYFVHQFKPRFDEHALLDDPEMLRAVTAINRQIAGLAPVLNSPSAAGAAVRSDPPDVPIQAISKRWRGDTYLFTVGLRNASARATFSLPGLRGVHTVEVIGENRTLTARAGAFSDAFAPYAVHLYQVPR